MGKSYPYSLYIGRKDLEVLEAWRKAGISRSSVLQMAIDDIPVQQVIQRLKDMQAPSMAEDDASRVSFSIRIDQRTILDTLTKFNVESSFVVRHSFRRYLDMDIEELMNIKGTMRAKSKQSTRIERDKLRAKLADGEKIDPKGASSRGRDAVVSAPPIPIRNPGIDWSIAGPVLPKTETSPEASQVAAQTASQLPPPKRAPAPRDSKRAVLEALNGISFTEAKAREKETRPELSPLEALRQMKANKK